MSTKIHLNGLKYTTLKLKARELLHFWALYLKSTRVQLLGGREVRIFINPQLWTEFYWPPTVDSAHIRLKCFLYVFIEVDYFKIFVSTIHQIEWFETWNSKKILGEPLPRPLSPALSRAFPSIRASPSNLGRFAPSIWALPNFNRPNFWPVVAPMQVTKWVFSKLQYYSLSVLQ